MKSWIALFLFAPSLLLTTELAPWFGKVFQIETHTSVLCQSYSRIKSGNHSVEHHENDQFLTLGGAFTFVNPLTNSIPLNGELEGTLANTRRQHPGLDNLRATVRAQILQDIPALDPFTVTVGLTLTKAFKNSLRDISSFHHGSIEGELHTAIGKEYDCHQFWLSRFWGVAGVGIGDHGSPWIRGDLNIERNYWDRNQMGIAVRTLWGLGGKKLHLHHFKGYGPVNHQSIDVGMRYTYFLDCDGYFGVEYFRRVYAKNFPAHTNLFRLLIMYPFSL